jgi:hypothetical protein
MLHIELQLLAAVDALVHYRVDLLVLTEHITQHLLQSIWLNIGLSLP